MVRDETSGKAAKSESKTNRSGSAKSGKNGGKGPGKETDAIALLKEDHRAVEKLFAEYEKATESSRKADIITAVATMLKIHAELEEAVYYPAVRKAAEADDALDEAQVEHDTLKILIADLESGSKPEFRDAKVKVLSEYVEHHVKEEEAGDGILEQGRKSGLDLMALGQQMAQLRNELLQDPSRLPDEPVSIGFPGQSPRSRAAKTGENDHGDTPERDEHGRFVAAHEDEDRDGSTARKRSK